MKLIYTFVLGLLCCAGSHSPSFAEEEPTCKEVLATLDWTLETPGLFSELRSEKAGQSLHGVICTDKEVTDWFEGHGWTFVEMTRADGGFYGASPKFRKDTNLIFCLPNRPLVQFLRGRCRGHASVVFYEGQITQMVSGPTK